MKKIDSVRLLKEEVLSLIRRNKLSQALKLIHDFVGRIVTEPLCTSQVFGSKTLDELCLRIGHINLLNLSDEMTVVESEKPVFVYIVTKLQKSGGHTRIIENFIQAQEGGQHVILLTGLEGKSDLDYVNNVLNKQNNLVLEQAPKADYLQRLTWLQKRLTGLSPKKVYLFNQHQDSVATAALQPEMELDAYFYHHGDHHLCLGVYLSHLKHIDPHPMGYHHCREKLGIDNIYVPLTAEDKGNRSPDLAFLHFRQLVTCTAARWNKIEVPYFVSYLELVPSLLKATGGRHIHIGQLTPWAIYKIKRGLKFYGIASDRFVYIKWVPSVWKALQENQVDLYIASIPYGGGVTLIEAMGAGIPVALHRHIFSEVLSGIDLAYPGAFSWRQPEELLNFCESVTSAELEKASKLGRMQFESFHSLKHLGHFLNDAIQYTLLPAKAANKFVVAADEWGLWMERQLNFRRLIVRTVYRAYRYFRAY